MVHSAERLNLTLPSSSFFPLGPGGDPVPHCSSLNWQRLPSPGMALCPPAASHSPFTPPASPSGGAWEVGSSAPAEGGLRGWSHIEARPRPQASCLGEPLPPSLLSIRLLGPIMSLALLTPLNKGAPRPAVPWMMCPSSGEV